MAIKRRASGSGASKKNSKMSKVTESNPKVLNHNEIKQLSDQIKESTKHYNNFVVLIQQYDHIKANFKDEFKIEETEANGRYLSLSLYRNFEELLKNQVLMIKKNDDEQRKTACKWLQSRYESFKAVILEFTVTDFGYKSSLQLDLLEMYLNLVKLESEHMRSNKEDLYFPTATYIKLVEALLLSENGIILPDGTTDNFIILEYLDSFKDNWDLQFYFVNQLSEKLLEWKNEKNKETLQLIISNFFTIFRNKLLFTKDDLSQLKMWTDFPPSVLLKHSAFKAQFQKAILTILGFPLLSSQYKSILLVLHKRIIPYMATPQHLMDFLTDSYDMGSVISILSLNSLFELMKNYNLEYPDFYKKLYSLFNQELLHTRYKSRFFRLCDLFLSSTHLPANLIASFIKRLARISLVSGASGVVITIPFIYNLMKRHPSCMIMLHNTEAFTEYSDPFDNSESDPTKTRAMQSSLWELETLMTHYHPNIATLAKIFGEPFRKQSYNMEDFLDWSYVTLLESESTRRYKKEAALEYEEWDGLFVSGENKTAFAEGWKW